MADHRSISPRLNKPTKSGDFRDQHAQSRERQNDDTGRQDQRPQDITPPRPPPLSRQTSFEGGATGARHNDDTSRQDQRPQDNTPPRPPSLSRQTSSEGGATDVRQIDDTGGHDPRSQDNTPPRPPPLSRQTSSEGGATGVRQNDDTGGQDQRPRDKDGLDIGKPPVPVSRQNSTGSGGKGTQIPSEVKTPATEQSGKVGQNSPQPNKRVTSLSDIKTAKDKPEPSDENGDEGIGSKSKTGLQDTLDNNGNTDTDPGKSKTSSAGTKSDVNASHDSTQNTEGESHDECPSPNTGPGNLGENDTLRC
ncbi:hypothetical protein DPMN_165128 [Dreissena polymorpha]|uniref:Uncharacterized protein n=1 Tax=Dreissena polymorpha TaxID=45954 RepID=A0A9D4IW31_DREPO|nr:hypothetical protein DPMN_165128 [Dreissena polymorpha]